MDGLVSTPAAERPAKPRVPLRPISSSEVPATSVRATDALILAVVAMSVRFLDLGGREINVDEYFHLIAGRSWAQDGTLALGDGVYLRARGYTLLLGWLFREFGDSLILARLPSAVAGGLLVAAVSYWTSRVAGRTAGWVAGLLLCFSHEAIEISQFARFYALHGLLFWLGAVTVFYLVSDIRKSAAGNLTMLVTAIAAFAASIHLQPITLIGLVGVAAWVGLDTATRWEWRLSTAGRKLLFWGFVLAMAAGAVLLVESREGTYLADEFARAAPWAEGTQHAPLFYLEFLRSEYTFLLVAIPFLAVPALIRTPRPALFCIVVTGVSLLLHSVAGMKHYRYIYYLLPFLFSVAALGSPVVIGWLLQNGKAVLNRAIGPTLAIDHTRRGEAFARSLLVVGMVIVLLPTMESYARSAFFVAQGTARAIGVVPPAEHEWSRLSREIAARIQPGDALVTNLPTAAIYHLGRVTYAFQEFPEYPELATDPRIGRPTFQTASSYRKVAACYPKGVVVIRISPRLSQEQRTILSELDRDAEKIPVSGGLPFAVYRWLHQLSEAAACPPKADD